jgi:hypothetical protein
MVGMIDVNDNGIVRRRVNIEKSNTGWCSGIWIRADDDDGDGWFSKDVSSIQLQTQ